MKIVSDNPKFLKELNRQLKAQRLSTEVETKPIEAGTKSGVETIAWVVISNSNISCEIESSH